MKIYLARDNVQAGPYTLDEFNRMILNGEVIASDLMWHAGMQNWQTVGHITDGRPYTPNAPTTPNPTPRGFGDNVDFNDHTKQQRPSVAKLYGRNTDEPTNTITPSKHTFVHDTKIEYASIFARLTAFAINMVLYILALLPLIMAFMQVVDMNEVAKHAQNYLALQTYSESLVKQIPNTTIAMSNLMFFALLGIQLLLIVMRGQSFGKMVMGIRVVDETTGKLPSLGTLIFMRTIFLVVLYAVGSSLASGIPAIIMLSANYLMAKSNDKKQGWHDKMTKTLTVKAKPSQLDKTKK